MYDRRRFLRLSSAAVSAGGLLSALPLSQAYAARQKISANDKVHIGVIGCKGVGWADLQAHLKLPDVEIVALCDVDSGVLNSRAAELEKITGKTAKLYSDYRQMLSDPHIDAVIIGTPDHWHCLMTVDACAAGKDVYVEKPAANSIAECRAMVAAQKRYDRRVQVGQWQRSHQHWQDAINYVQSGKIGRVRLVKAWAYLQWIPKVPALPDGPVPAGVDYNMWLGPAPLHAFNPNRFHFNFRWFWDYGGGFMTDWGVHLIDIALLGMKSGMPKSKASMGGKYAYPDGGMQTPDSQTAIFDFGDYSLEWEHAIGIGTGPYGGSDHGVAFVGSLGTLVADRRQWVVLPESEGGRFKTEALPIQNAQGDGVELHAANFVACIKDRDLALRCPIESAAQTASICHMGNIAFRTGQTLEWQGQEFKASPTANALITPTYRSPWIMPS